MIRKATREDLPAIVDIYNEIHDREAASQVTTGWLRGIYPVSKTAEDSIERGDMFVLVEEDDHIIGTGIINQIQVDVYAKGAWTHPAQDDEVMVLHTLIISKRRVKQQGRGGYGTEFLRFYEDYAKAHGCSSLRLDTNARNKAARAFYKKNGYQEIGIVPTTFNGIPGVDLVLIEKCIR